MRIIYLAGCGRSGTTILSRILGAATGVCSVGELRHFWTFWRWKDRICSCDRVVTECDFWGPVLDNVSMTTGLNEEELYRAREAVSRQRHLPALVRKVRRGGGLTSEELVYVRVMLSAYEAACRQSGADVVIDASKQLCEPLLLELSHEVDVRVIHLVREPRSVAKSWQTRKADPSSPDRGLAIYPPVFSSTLWTLTNAACEIGLGHALRSRFVSVRFEDLMRNPRQAIGSLAAAVGIEPESLPFVSSSAVALEVGHIAIGNPDRLHHGTIELREETIPRLPFGQSLGAILPALPLMPMYGYHLRRKRSLAPAG